MIKKFAFTSLCIIVIVGALVGIKLMQFQAMAAAGASMVPPPETVTAAPAREEEWPNTVAATGTVAAVQGVTVGAEVAGKVSKIAFEAGAVVQAGDLLVQLDTSSEDAQLRAAEASAQLAKANLERSRNLSENATISEAEFDAADAQHKQAVAQVDAIRATIEKKTIRAPFAGRLGLRLVNLGQILREGEAIATLQTMDPVYVNFSMPQQRLPVLNAGGMVRITTDAAPDASFEGQITAISPEIDAVTRNVRVQATVANVGEKLRTGMFANVEVVLPSTEKHLVVPVTSILYAPYGDSVFIVEEKKNEQTGQVEQVLRQQFVRVGLARGDFVTITSGLKPGDQVVSSGVFKLRGGMPVVVDNTLAPKAELTPKPANT